MNEEKTASRKWIPVAIVLLVLLVLLSSIWLGIQINKFITREVTTDIDLQAALSAGTSATIPDGAESGEKDDQSADLQSFGESAGNTSGTSESHKNTDSGSHAGTTAAPYVPAPGFVMGNGTGTAEITLFRSAYTNAAGEQVAASFLGDKIVAPGTANSHKVYIRNTGNCALDYTLIITDLFAGIPQGGTVPIEVRISNYRGAYLVGSDSAWVPLQELADAMDTDTVGKGSYVYYTVEWRWPYEAGVDENIHDTMLGNVSDTAIECGIKIIASAQESADPNAVGGISIPSTGDTAKLALWVSGFVLSFFLIVLLLLFRPERKREEADS